MSKIGSYGPMQTEKTPARRKRDAKRRRAQERRWAAKSGPVVIVKPAEK